MIWLIIVGLMAVGMILLVAEVAIIPGFGVAGVAAALFLIAGVSTTWVYYGPTWGVGSLLLAGGLTIALITLAPRTRAGKALVLETAITAQHVGDEYAWLVGKSGKAVTDLRPAGAAEIDGRRVDVVTDGEYIESGSAVRVLSVEGSRVLVGAA